MSIFVGNLPFRAEREDVIQLFAPFGEILNKIFKKLDDFTGQNRLLEDDASMVIFQLK